MSADINSQINSRIQSFVAELADLVRVASLEAVLAALGGSAAPQLRGPGRPKGSGRKPGRPAKAASLAPPQRRAGRRVRRSSEDVGATAAKLLAFVKAHDGKRLEEISKGLGIDSADLKLPAQKLIAAKSLRTTGQKRGTKYHLAAAAGRGAKKPAAPKLAKKVLKPAKASAAKKAAKKAARPAKAKLAQPAAAPEPSMA